MPTRSGSRCVERRWSCCIWAVDSRLERRIHRNRLTTLSVPPLDLNDPVAVLLAVDRALRDDGIHAALYGGLALAAYGTPRETRDADVAVAGPSGAQALGALTRAGIDATLAFDRLVFGGNLVSRLTLISDSPLDSIAAVNTADLIEPRSPRYSRLALSRALEGDLREMPIRVLTPEDFILFKLLSTRDRDLEDATSVVSEIGLRLDVQFIRDQAALLEGEVPDHDVMGRLRRVEGLQ